MKVVVHPADEGGSGCYRLIWPAKALIKQGADIAIRMKTPYMVEKMTSPFGDSVVGLHGKPDGDVIVFQRPLRRDFYELMGVLQKMGKAVVVELDDAFHALPAHNPVRKDCDPLLNRDMNWIWLEKACAQADWVTCTTQALADRYAPHGRVSVIPNYVPKWYTDIPRPKNKVPVVGWTGTLATHSGDLQVTQGAIGRVLADVEAQLAVVGTGVGVANALKSPEPRACGWVDIKRYPREMAKFDVGIVPLRINAFNNAKSRLKSLEFASLGIPCVSSPIEDNVLASEAGLCELATNPDEWFEMVKNLLSDKDFREHQGSKAREAVIAKHTIEANAHKWMEAFENAFARKNCAVAA